MARVSRGRGRRGGGMRQQDGIMVDDAIKDEEDKESVTVVRLKEQNPP